MDKIREALEALKIAHIECEDDWYSCPKCDNGCSNEYAGTECNCGADAHNKRVDELLDLLSAPVASDARELAETITIETLHCTGAETVKSRIEKTAMLLDHFASERERKAREEGINLAEKQSREWYRAVANDYDNEAPLWAYDLAQEQKAERAAIEEAGNA